MKNQVTINVKYHLNSQILMLLILLILPVVFTTRVLGQADDGGDVIKIDTKIVQTTLRVSKPNSNKAMSVNQSDLQLLVDGKSREIAYFETDRVKKFIVLLDSSRSMAGNRYKRTIWFLNELAESSLPGQSFDVITFADKTQSVGTFTKKDTSIIKKLKRIEPDGTRLYTRAL